MSGFATRAIHGSASGKKDPHGALRMPVYDTVAFEFATSQDLENAFAGRKPAHAYSRITNPTVDDFEQKVRALANAAGVIAVSSGMASISAVVLAVAEAGSNIVTSRHLFGHTLSLFEKTFGAWGLSTRFADMTDPASVEAAIDADTRAIFLESITNPQLEVADIRDLVVRAGRHGVPVILDGTMTTPYLFPARDSGVAVEVLSSTKYISGGATCIGGLIIDNGVFDWSANPKLREDAGRFGPHALLMRLRREVYRNLGVCFTAQSAYLHTLGLETLALRIERSCANALEMARSLSQHPSVRAVNYPGLPGSPYHEVARRQFTGGFGGILTFELDGKETCYRFMDALRVIRRATNLNDNKTLIIHPASTIFHDFSPEERTAMGVSDRLIRVSVGIEEIRDLIEDINQGLESV